MREIFIRAFFWLPVLTLHATEFGGMISDKYPSEALRESVGAGRLVWLRTAGGGNRPLPANEQAVIYPGATWKPIPVAGGVIETAYPADLWKVFNAARSQFVAGRPGVSAWEIGNEPDFIFSRDLPDLTAAATKAAWLGLREAGARGRIFMPSLAFRPGPYGEQLVANDIAAFSDGWNFHFYGWAQDFEGNIREHRRLLGEHGLNLPLWITEAGYAELAGNGSRPPAPLLHRQAAYFERIVIEAWMLGVEGFAAFILSPYHADGNDYGLVDRDLSPRPALARYFNLVRDLPACRPLFHLRDIDTHESVGIVIRRNDGGWWTVLWTPTRRAENNLPPPRSGAPALTASPTSFHSVRLHLPPNADTGTSWETLKPSSPGLPLEFVLSAGTNLHVVSKPGKFHIENVDWIPWKPVPKRRRSESSGPVVVQIRPVGGAVPDRDGLCYRVPTDRPVMAEIVAYNFSRDPASGVLRVEAPEGWKSEGLEAVKLRLGPYSAATNVVTLTAGAKAHSQMRYSLSATWEASKARDSKASAVLAPVRSDDEPFELAPWSPQWHSDPPGTKWDVDSDQDGPLRLRVLEAPAGELPGLIAALPDDFVARATDVLHLVLRHHEGIRPSGVRVELVTKDRVVTCSNRTVAIPPEGREWDFRFGDFEAAFWSHADPERKWKPSDIRYVRIQFGEIMPGSTVDLVSVELRRVPSKP